MKITPLGDSALIVDIVENFEKSPGRTLAAVLQTMRWIEEAAIPGIVELAPAYTTVAVFFDPTSVIDSGANDDGVFDWLGARIDEAVAGKMGSPALSPSRPVVVPVCYHPDFGFDLAEVARQTRRSIQEIVDLHSGAEYLVSCIGFTPGFPYLSGLPNELIVPRHPSPRKDVPAGSVAIAGHQGGIYPLSSPGGWNILGRTPLRLFDPAKDPPALLRAGDRVRFQSMTLEQFKEFKP